MNRKLISAVAVLVLNTGIFAQDAQVPAKKFKELVSIDSILLMQKSKEGKVIAERIQKDVEKFQDFARSAQKELVEFQETVSKQAKVLSKEALMEKGEKLEKMKKNAERELADREAELKKEIQKEQFSLRDKQLVILNEVFEAKGWGLLIDRNTPGVLCVANAIDKTDEVLKVVDERYEKEISKNSSKSKTEKKA